MTLMPSCAGTAAAASAQEMHREERSSLSPPLGEIRPRALAPAPVKTKLTLRFEEKGKMHSCKYRGKWCQPLNLFCQVVPRAVSSRTSFHSPSTQPMHRGPRSSPLCHHTFLSLSVISSPPKGVIVPGEVLRGGEEAVPPKETTDRG